MKIQDILNILDDIGYSSKHKNIKIVGNAITILVDSTVNKNTEIVKISKIPGLVSENSTYSSASKQIKIGFCIIGIGNIPKKQTLSVSSVYQVKSVIGNNFKRLDGVSVKSVNSAKILSVHHHTEQTVIVTPKTNYNTILDAKTIQNDIYEALVSAFPRDNVVINTQSNSSVIGDIRIVPHGKIRPFIIRIYIRTVNTLLIQDTQVERIRSSLFDISKTNGGAVYIQFTDASDRHWITNIQYIRHSSGKSDFAFITVNNTKIYISLKADDYQQWAGLTEVSNSPNISTAAKNEITSFTNAVGVAVTTSSLTKYYSRPINDKEIVMLSMYGSQYSNGSSNENNVDYVIIGTAVDLDSTGSIVKFKNASVHKKGDTVGNPYFFSKYTFGRSDFNIPNTRLVVWPGIGPTPTRGTPI